MGRAATLLHLIAENARKLDGVARRQLKVAGVVSPTGAPSASASTSLSQAPQLELPAPLSLVDDLASMGLRSELADEASRAYHNTAQALAEEFRTRYRSIRSGTQTRGSDADARFQTQLEATLVLEYTSRMEKLRQKLLDRARTAVHEPARTGSDHSRRSFNQSYKPVLEQSFASNPNPGAEERNFLAQKTGMSRKQIDVWFVNKRMRTAKYERAEPLAPHVTFVHYDVPEPNLHSMVDQLGGIAYARGTSILSQASDDYLFADGDGEDEDYDFSGDEETQGLAGARRDHRDDEADPLEAVLDFETVYWSTEEDVSGLCLKPSKQRKRKYHFDAPVPCHAYPAKFPAPRMLQAQLPLATPWRRSPASRPCARHSHLTVDELADEFGRLSVKPVIIRERLPKRLEHPLNSYRRLHPPSQRADRSAATCAYTTTPLAAPTPWTQALPSLPVKVKSLPLQAKLVPTSPDLCPAVFASPTSEDWLSFAVKPRARILIGKRRTSGSVAAGLPTPSWREPSPFVRDEPVSPRPEPALLRSPSPSPPLEKQERLRHTQKRARSREPRAASPAVSEPARKRARTGIPRLPSLDIASAASSPASSTGPLTPKTPAMRISPRKVATLPRRVPTSAPKGQVPQIPTRPSSVASFRSFTSASEGSVVDTPTSVAMTLVDDAELAAPAPLKKAAAFGWAQGGAQSIADLDWLHSPEVQDAVRASSNRTPRLGDYFA